MLSCNSCKINKKLFCFQRFMETTKPTLKKHQIRIGEDLSKINLVSDNLDQNFPDITGLSPGSVMQLEGKDIYCENNEYSPA